MNEAKSFFHLFADGSVSKGFILTVKDYIAVMNIVAVCAANSCATVVAFSLEDTHPHFLLNGFRGNCVRFLEMFETIYRHFVTKTRPYGFCPHLHLDMYPVGDEQNLRNVAVYVVNQPTKDGKRVMPYDYPWGSGSLYFRGRFVPVWLISENGSLVCPVTFSSIGSARQREILHTRHYTIPPDWLVAGELILPTNYVDVQMFESIYKTHNAFRVFLSSNKSKDDEVRAKIAEARGVMLEDTEARQICGDECLALFGNRNVRRLDPMQRVRLAQVLRRKHRLSIRQLSSVVRLPEVEVRRYVS